MSPASFPVLGVAALVSSPALYHGLVDQTLPLEQMLTRYLIAVALVWAALSVLAMLVGPAPVPAQAEQPEAVDEITP